MVSGKEIVRLAKKAIKEQPEAFEALLEFERTGKLPKIGYKTRANFTIDAALLRKFREYCKKNGMKMSAVLEKYIKEELQSQTSVSTRRKYLRAGCS